MRMQLHPLVKGLVFAFLVPGSFAGWIPWLLDRRFDWALPFDTGPFRWPGLVMVAIGGAVYLWCAWDFAMAGRGTPAAFDPPVRLVIRGLYNCTRNPMYVGILTLLTGEALLYDSIAIVIYALTAWIVFHLFILFHEEPHLTRDFGEEYVRYRTRVNRWIPRCTTAQKKAAPKSRL